MRDVKRNPMKVLNSLREHSSVSDYKFERLYRILFNEEMYYVAYQNIYASQGNMTPGTDGETFDGMSVERIQNLITTLKDESYHTKPARRVYIPKKNGKMRPLGIPSAMDKLLQEVVRMILEAIYEGYFEYTSHGFRPERSCHTALAQIQKEFTGKRWFIEGDIKGFFDNINHDVMIGILRERISDERFLRLIRKFLKAGYIEHWEYNKTYSGTPQGGIVSPILANIYLDKFDKYIKEYAQKFDEGKYRGFNKKYISLCGKVQYLGKKIKAESDESVKATLIAQQKDAHKEMLSTTPNDDMDENYRRLKYVRYADDFLIGVAGTKAECEKIKADIADFMRDNLKLELSDEKTLITNAQDNAHFLGYEISVRKSNVTKRNCNGHLRRSFNSRVLLTVPLETAKKRLESYDVIKYKDINGKAKWWPKARKKEIGKAPEKTLSKYNSEIRGFYNYYSLAHNISYVGGAFGYIMKYSFFMTMAKKFRSSVKGITSKYRMGKDFVVPYTDEKGRKKNVVLYNDGFKQKKPIKFANIDDLPDRPIITPIPTNAERLLNGVCELCGKKDKLVMHQVRSMKVIDKDTEWGKLMLKRGRKTLAVCQTCYEKILNSGTKIEKTS